MGWKDLVELQRMGWRKGYHNGMSEERARACMVGLDGCHGYYGLEGREYHLLCHKLLHKGSGPTDHFVFLSGLNIFCVGGGEGGF